MNNAQVHFLMEYCHSSLLIFLMTRNLTRKHEQGPSITELFNESFSFAYKECDYFRIYPLASG